MTWLGFTPLEPVCPDCGARLPEWAGPLELDWRDDDERRRGAAALAIQTHRHAEHRVDPHLGDIIRYSQPWRGHVLTSELYRVDAIYPDYDLHAWSRHHAGWADGPPLLVTRLVLVDVRRVTERCYPNIGDPRSPLTIAIERAAPPVQPTLLDLLTDWNVA